MLFVEQILNKLTMLSIPYSEFEMDEFTLNQRGFHEVAQKKAKADPKYCDHHAAAFGRKGYRWPPTQADCLAHLDAKIITTLNQRPLELCLYIAKAFPPIFKEEPEPGKTISKIEWADLNLSMERM